MSSKSAFSGFRLIASLPIVYVVVTFYLPIVLMAIESLRSGGVETYRQVLLNPDYLSIIGYSGFIALVVTLTTLALSIPAAYYLAFHVKDEAQKNNYLVAFTVPMLVNFLLKAYALMNVFSLIGLANSFPAIIIGMTYEYLPLMLLPVYSTFERVEKRLLEAAETLGARPHQTVFRVLLPVSLPGIFSGVTLVFLMSFTEFVVPAMLGGVYGYTVGFLIWDLFLKYRNWVAGSILALLITLVSILAVYVYMKWGVELEA
ncbi:MAG: ABC transporter permease [Thermofilum sp.]|uniref:ABC transporter permease n=1 Tax=Thermofilum sp. TaxID=1961369 RepID=UPI00258B45AC|nr:ABC transporter permease [Thermofilum sp.]MCI4408264.1 ABC transporter permease [Thermofilum sp.]